MKGLEPPRVLSPVDFESTASAVPPHPLGDVDYSITINSIIQVRIFINCIQFTQYAE